MSQHVVGTRQLTVEGLAPRAGLQNIPGANWPNPPMAMDYVTYCYLREDVSTIEATAKLYNATFRKESVRVDNGKYARHVFFFF